MLLVTNHYQSMQHQRSSHSEQGHSPILKTLRNPCSAGAQSRYPDIQPATAFHATSDPHFTLDVGWISEVSSSLTIGKLNSSNILEDPSSDSTGHGSGSENATAPDESCDIRRGLEQQPLDLSRFARTSRYDTHHEDILFGFPFQGSLHNQRHPDTSDALADSRAIGFAEDESAASYFHSFDGHRREPERTTIDKDEYEEAQMQHSPDVSPQWRHGHQLRACLASDPTFSSIILPRDSSPVSPSTFSSTSATTTAPIYDGWKCGNCGRVLATKGTKNRNRNKRRHHCPGTGPKYACPECPKSFNRGDTRLLHLRKGHPEINIKPPRPRKRRET